MKEIDNEFDEIDNLLKDVESMNFETEHQEKKILSASPGDWIINKLKNNK